MSESQSPVQEHQALSPPRTADSRLPTGFRIVHVHVPESIFNYAKAQAYLSGLRFPVYVARVLGDARPYEDRGQPRTSVDVLVPKAVQRSDPPT